MKFCVNCIHFRNKTLNCGYHSKGEIDLVTGKPESEAEISCSDMRYALVGSQTKNKYDVCGYEAKFYEEKKS